MKHASLSILLIKIYTNYGFAITNILGYRHFETMGTSEVIQGVTLKIATNNEHDSGNATSE